ncbi:MAG: hypothetical protein ACLSHO_04170 [Dysosmobacter sp.]
MSSATIRNELSDLVELGYLEQPHTSAGRVPSPKGYRLYVNELMERQRLSYRRDREDQPVPPDENGGAGPGDLPGGPGRQQL